MRGANNPNHRGAGHHTCITCGKGFQNYNKARRACSLKCRPFPSPEARAKLSAAGKRAHPPGDLWWRPSKDANHDEIVAALEAAGCSVIEIHMLGHGAPDVITHRADTGEIVLLEIKNPKSKHVVTPAQRRWHARWQGGPVHIVRTAAEALAATGIVVHSRKAAG